MKKIGLIGLLNITNHFSFLAFGDSNTKAFYCFASTYNQIAQGCTITYNQDGYKLKLATYSGITVIASGEYESQYLSE